VPGFYFWARHKTLDVKVTTKEVINISKPSELLQATCRYLIGIQDLRIVPIIDQTFPQKIKGSVCHENDQ